jgi:hypothetical protein
VWQVIAAAAIPLVTAVVGLLQGRGGLNRKIREHAALLEVVREVETAKDKLAELVGLEADALLVRERARMKRKINSTNLTLAILLAVVTGGSIYGFVNWTISWWGMPFGWIALVASIIVGLFLTLIVAAGFMQVYNPPRDKKSLPEPA